ncbi:PfkB family carbohydrate kinase [Antarcticirhabdus aurantiaca]|uniref:PfkB family carbohydrate kinase n=1 Tax=Antarcticirhabdus aurantiaca TaxID=2606717 RepID=A0ACD4NUD8_9HYPH|nr:PfkB family carbohydrate kinase [Antarcticirhabdus aurantiaca]WAJ30335.1 PfkB family carbohydrate kinase [Jeongeuplla avenae]
MARPLLIAFGSINADFQVRTGEAVEPGRTMLADGFSRLGGGKAANRAFLAHRLGHGARLIGQVGRDDLAAQALAPLEAVGLDLGHVMRRDGVSTAVSMIMVPPDGKKTIVLAANANDDWSDDNAEAAFRAIAEAPTGSILSIDCEVPVNLVRRALRAAADSGLRSILDPSPADRVDDALLEGLLSVTPNPKEAGGILDRRVESEEDAVEAAIALRDKGVKSPCVKMEDGGCVVVHRNEISRIAPLKTEPVDTTGAGDAFAGGLCAALLDGRPMSEAAAFAVASSSLAVRGWGSQEAYADRAAIEAALPDVLAGMRRVRRL